MPDPHPHSHTPSFSGEGQLASPGLRFIVVETFDGARAAPGGLQPDAAEARPWHTGASSPKGQRRATGFFPKKITTTSTAAAATTTAAPPLHSNPVRMLVSPYSVFFGGGAAQQPQRGVVSQQGSHRPRQQERPAVLQGQRGDAHRLLCANPQRGGQTGSTGNLVSL